MTPFVRILILGFCLYTDMIVDYQDSTTLTVYSQKLVSAIASPSTIVSIYTTNSSCLILVSFFCNQQLESSQLL